MKNLFDTLLFKCALFLFIKLYVAEISQGKFKLNYFKQLFSTLFSIQYGHNNV